MTARVAAYQETAEGRGRRRKFEWMLKSFIGFTPEEKSEYEHLQTLYPDLPMDSDNRLKPVYDKDGGKQVGSREKKGALRLLRARP